MQTHCSCDFYMVCTTALLADSSPFCQKDGKDSAGTHLAYTLQQHTAAAAALLLIIIIQLATALFFNYLTSQSSTTICTIGQASTHTCCNIKKAVITYTQNKMGTFRFSRMEGACHLIQYHCVAAACEKIFTERENSRKYFPGKT